LTVGPDDVFYGTTYNGGSSSMGAIVRVGIPPSITTQPTSVTVANGATASIKPTVSGMPLNYQWFTSSGRTSTAVPYFVNLPGQVQSVIILDGGAGYSSIPIVQFVGGSGSSASGTAMVNNGVVTSININNHGFYLSRPTIQISNPSPAVDQPLVGQTNAVLTLSGVTSANTTNYFVVVTNASGSVTSAVVALTVFLPPQYITAQNLASGMQVQLTGTPNYPYILQSVSNLMPPISWQSIFTNPADLNGNWQFTETNLSGVQKYYRAIGQ
jgi:hypothetical protein